MMVKPNSKVKEMIMDLKYISPFYSHNKNLTILHNNHTLD